MRTKRGKPCSAPAINGTNRCFSHTGSNASFAGTRGGLRRTVYDLSALAPCDVPKNTEDVLHLLAQTLSDVRTGAMDPRTAGVLCMVCSAYLSAYEMVELERQVAELERSTQPRLPELSP
jgi:molybdopterin-guanine dinucleotide biosynthesis protein A